MSEILTDGTCARCRCFVGDAIGHVCFVHDSATHAPMRIHLIDETVTLREENAALRAEVDTANRWLICDEHGVPDWREPHCLFCELAKRAAALDKAKAALREIKEHDGSDIEVRAIAARALAELEGKK